MDYSTATPFLQQNGHDTTTPNKHLNGHAATPRPDTLQVLADNHRALIEASAIRSDVAKATSYQTIENSEAGRARLRELGFDPRTQMLTPALHIPAHDVYGNTCPGQIRPDIPRNDGRKNKPIKYETPKGARLIVDVPPMVQPYIHDPNEELWISEGKRKADSAVSQGLRCVSIMGVNGWRCKNEEGGTVALPCWESIALNGRRVVLAFDSDVTRKDEVQRALERLKLFLESRGAIVRVLYLPEGPSGEKTGLDDFFARGGTVQVLAEHIADALRPTDKKRAKAEKIAVKEAQLKAIGLPVIETNGRQQTDVLHDLCGAIETANAKQSFLFRSFVGLVTIGSDATEQARMKATGRAALTGIAGEAAQWISTTEREGIRDVNPSRDLCEIYLSTEKYWRGVPFLDSTATAPFFAADGTLCDTTGYHPPARVWLQLPKGFIIGDTRPTPENIKAARHLILEDILGEVAFADAASRAHAVALMFLPFVRKMINADTPLHLGNAPLRGSGKTYALELCILPFTTPTLTPEKGTEEEWRKSIICELATGPTHIFLDNIKKNLNSATLDAAITSPSGFIRERLTGTGQMVTASTRCVWVATANNAQLTEDAATRSIVIQLDTNSENPDQRKFKNDPKEFIQQNRAQVVTAILTLIQAWKEAGQPDYRGPHSCRCHAWRRVMGGILEVAGIEGFLENVQAQRESIGANASGEWHEFTETWFELHGNAAKTAAELLPLVMKIPDFAALLEGLGEAARAKKLAQWISAKRDRVFSKFKIQISGEIQRKRAFRVILTEKPPEKPDFDPKPTELTELTELSTVKARKIINKVKCSKVDTKSDDPRLYGESSVSSVSSVSSAPEMIGGEL